MNAQTNERTIFTWNREFKKSFHEFALFGELWHHKLFSGNNGDADIGNMIVDGEGGRDQLYERMTVVVCVAA